MTWKKGLDGFLLLSEILRKRQKDIVNVVYIRQLVRSAGSAGANYIEENDNVSVKDQAMKSPIYKWEAKDPKYWLKYVLTYNDNEQAVLRCVC